MTYHFRRGQAKKDQVRTGQVRSVKTWKGQVSSGQVRLGHVRKVYLGSSMTKRITLAWDSSVALLSPTCLLPIYQL